jgi:hypothetical protein
MLGFSGYLFEAPSEMRAMVVIGLAAIFDGSE